MATIHPRISQAFMFFILNVNRRSNTLILKGKRLHDHGLQALNCQQSDWKRIKRSDPDTSITIFPGARKSTLHAYTKCVLTTLCIPILHSPTVWSEAWSLSLSGFWFLSNISSTTHRPTVNCYFLTVTKWSQNTEMRAHEIWWEGWKNWSGCHSIPHIFYV